ncbi:MAG: GNAT family N-acetyltransferase, partial [Methanobacteriota archaeon]
ASGGLLVSRDLPAAKREQVAAAVLASTDARYGSQSAFFRLKSHIYPSHPDPAEFKRLFLRHGFLRVEKAGGYPCTHVLPLEQPFEERIWRGLWSHKVRKRIGKAERTGVEVIADDRLRYIDDFRIMLERLFLRYGKPPLSEQMVDLRLRTFPQRTKLFIALYKGQPIAGLLCYYTPTTCYLSKAPSQDEAYRLSANLCLFAHAIRDASETGYRYVEFGITSTPSGETYKTHFKGTRVPIGIYEKQYSMIKTLLHSASDVGREIRHGGVHGLCRQIRKITEMS